MNICPVIVFFCIVINWTIGESQTNHQVEPLVLTIGDKVAAWSKEDAINPEELINDVQYPVPVSSDEMGSSYVTFKLWPGGIIPYVIIGGFSPIEYDKIMEAINDIHSKTCVRFVPRIDELIYIRISSFYGGCYSSVGYRDIIYDLNLQIPTCLYYKGTIIHELLHVIGLFHEHTRIDRDMYVKVNWDNIPINEATNFIPYPVDAYHAPYNYGSLMHYSNRAFSINGLPTLENKYQIFGDVVMGQRLKLTDTDIETVNMRYNCPQLFNFNVDSESAEYSDDDNIETENLYSIASSNSLGEYGPVDTTHNTEVYRGSVVSGRYTVIYRYANDGSFSTYTYETQFPDSQFSSETDSYSSEYSDSILSSPYDYELGCFNGTRH